MGENFNGELGNGTEKQPRYSWGDVSGIEDATALSMYAKAVCALMEDTTVRCWGDNRFGGLGVGPVTGPSQNTPWPEMARTPTGILRGVVEVSPVASMTCARTMYGEVLCAGDPTFGNPNPLHDIT